MRELERPSLKSKFSFLNTSVRLPTKYVLLGLWHEVSFFLSFFLRLKQKGTDICLLCIMNKKKKSWPKEVLFHIQKCISGHEKINSTALLCLVTKGILTHKSMAYISIFLQFELESCHLCNRSVFSCLQYWLCFIILCILLLCYS